MKTADVRIGQRYLYKDKIVTISKKIIGKLTSQPNMHSGILFTGFKRRQKKFLLSSGDEVYSSELEEVER